MKFPYGEIITELPEDFSPPETWPEYAHIAEPFAICKREAVGKKPRGIRWSLWPLCFEEYVSDIEPDLETSDIGDLTYNRIITWKRVSKKDIPPGWRVLSNKPWRIDGFHVFEKNADYLKKWHKNARRDARIWRENFQHTKHVIERISFTEYKTAYKRSTSAKKAGTELLSILGRMVELEPFSKNIYLWGVRNISSKEIIAGTAVINSPTYKSSIRYCPFMLEEGKRSYASTALVDHWFKESQNHGVEIQIFSCFWHPGVPDSFKGFSEFKSHFGLSYVAYPPVLYRIKRGKIF